MDKSNDALRAKSYQRFNPALRKLIIAGARN